MQNKIIKRSKQNTNVYNLLDNSDFRNPVAQAGIPGMHGTIRYAIDRWITNTATVTRQTNCLRASGSTWSVELRQYIDNVSTLYGKTLTFAVKLRSPMKRVYIGIFPSNNNGMIEGTYRTLWFNAKADWDVAVVKCTIPAEATALYVAINNPNEGVNNHYEVQLAALYEGEYTKDTLPEYQPKGISNEKASCMRYFVDTSRDPGAIGYISAANTAYVMFPLPQKMRVNPSITIADGGSSRIWCKNRTYQVYSYTLQEMHEAGATYKIVTEGGMPVGEMCHFSASKNIALNADL